MADSGGTLSMVNKVIGVNTSNSLPVCTDHKKISKESWAPALTSSPLLSTARVQNCAGRGEVNVRKFRYLGKKKITNLLLVTFPKFCCAPIINSNQIWFHLCRSNALTVPSREALTMTKPLEVKVTQVTLLLCSVNVTKQRPLLEFHTLI